MRMSVTWDTTFKERVPYHRGNDYGIILKNYYIKEEK